MRGAARVSDDHNCPAVTALVPHNGGPVVTGCETVLIEGLYAARVGDVLSCNGPDDTIAQGEATVLIQHALAARIGDATAHGGVIVEGAETVLIGL